MSTRSSIVYVAGLHIYTEVLTEDICIEYYPCTKTNSIYDDCTLSFQELYEIYYELRRYIQSSDKTEIRSALQNIKDRGKRDEKKFLKNGG